MGFVETVASIARGNNHEVEEQKIEEKKVEEQKVSWQKEDTEKRKLAKEVLKTTRTKRREGGKRKKRRPRGMGGENQSPEEGVMRFASDRQTSTRRRDLR